MKKYFKRYLALVLTFALVLAVPFVFTQQADAAAKKSKKTVKYTQEVKWTHTYKNEKGKTVKDVTKYSYNKKGFITKAYQKGKDGFKEVYKYNKKGYLKSFKSYNGKGKLTKKISVKMNKKGMPATVKFYDVNGKKSTLTRTIQFVYNGKKPVKFIDHDISANETYTEMLSDYGYGSFDPVDERQDYKQPWDGATNVKKDKKGRVTSQTFVDNGSDEDGSWTDTEVMTTKYNKAGYRIKTTYKYTSVFKFADGTSSTSKSTSVSNYKTFKLTKSLANIRIINNIALGWYY